jgi:hypothetical protein
MSKEGIMAKDKSRNYSLNTIKRLYALSGNQCAFPGCGVKFFTDDIGNISNICHIEDAHKSLAAPDRYNPSMTDEERAGYNNLILLCPNHHNITDNINIYSVTVLKKMKEKHIQKVANSMNTQSLIKNPSVLNEVINYIGVDLFKDNDHSEIKIAPRPDEKIRYNNIQRYEYIIKEYSIYQGKLNKIYAEIEKEGSNKKNIILKKIRQLYLLEKGKFADFTMIQENADSIIDSIKDKLWKNIEQSKNYDINLAIEVVEISLLVIIVDAFMRCEILEEPKQ